MHQAPTMLVIILGLSALLSAYLAAWAQVHARVPAAREFSFMVLCVAVYTMGAVVEISRFDTQGVLQAVRVEYLGLAFIPGFFMLFTLRFIYAKPPPRYLTILFMVIPVITLIMVYTMEYHHFFYINPRVIDGPYFPVLAFERGFWYYVNFAYIQTISLVSIILLVINAFRSPKRQRRQAIAVAVGSLFPTVGMALYIVGLFPGKMDPGPITLSITGVAFAIALFRLGMFELVPAARELAMDSVQEGLLVVDQHGNLQDLNKAAWRLPGATKLKIGDPLPGENPLAVNLKPLLKNAKDSAEFSSGDAESGSHYYDARAYPILNWRSKSSGTAILISEITETVGLLQQLNHQANTDELTGIFNRRHLMKLGSHEVDVSRRNGLPLGVIQIDLDHFKLINDQYGHAAGDDVLREVVKCFRNGLRNIDILGRYGGEEFAVFLPGADFNSTYQVAKRIKQHLDDSRILIEGKRQAVTASFGVYSTIAGNETTIDDLMKIADLALYQAKNKGRNQIAMPPDRAKD